MIVGALLTALGAALLSCGHVDAQSSVAAYNSAVTIASNTFFAGHALNYTYTAMVYPAAGVNASKVSVAVFRQAVVGLTVPSTMDGTTKSVFIAAVQSIETMFFNIQTNVAVAQAPSGVDANLYSARFSNAGYPLNYIGNALSLYPQIVIQSFTATAVDPVREQLNGVYTASLAQFQALQWSQYSFYEQQTCIFCAAKDPNNPSRSSPSIVNVQLNQVVSVTDAVTKRAISTSGFFSMLQWFALVKQAIDRSSLDTLSVTYDSSTGCVATFRYVDWLTTGTASDIPTYYMSNCSPVLHPADTSYTWLIVLVVLLVVALLGCVCGFVIWKYKCRRKREADTKSIEPSSGVVAPTTSRQSGDVEMSGFGIQSPAV